MTKAELKEMRHQLKMYSHYAYTYGNASGECEYGYPQHPGYICGLCGQDRSEERTCPKAAAR